VKREVSFSPVGRSPLRNAIVYESTTRRSRSSQTKRPHLRPKMLALGRIRKHAAGAPKPPPPDDRKVANALERALAQVTTPMEIKG